MTKRVTLMLDDGIDDMLVELAGSTRKRGSYVSDLVRAAWAAKETQDSALDLETLAMSLKVVDRRLAAVEDQVAALIARDA